MKQNMIAFFAEQGCLHFQLSENKEKKRSVITVYPTYSYPALRLHSINLFRKFKPIGLLCMHDFSLNVVFCI